MATVSAPRLAASVGMNVFDGLLLKAYPSWPIEEMSVKASLQQVYCWLLKLCKNTLMSSPRAATAQKGVL